MPSFESAPATHCHHVRSSGVRCGSLALRDKRYCYYHQRSRPLMVGSKNRGTPVLLALPLFEDAHAIQATLHSVVFHLLEGTMDHKTGSLLLYAMQIASSNLKHMKIETPAPGESIVDLPKLSEIPDPEPHQETSRLNSHTHASHAFSLYSDGPGRILRRHHAPVARTPRASRGSRQRNIRPRFAHRSLPDNEFTRGRLGPARSGKAESGREKGRRKKSRRERSGSERIREERLLAR